MIKKAFGDGDFNLAAMTIGLSMLAAQYWGKKDKAAVERIFAYVMKITAGVAFVFFTAALFFPKLLMGLLTNEPILMEGGAEYLRLAAFVLKLPVMAVYFIVSLDELLKLPAVYINYKKYKWVKDLTNKEAT